MTNRKVQKEIAPVFIHCAGVNLQHKQTDTLKKTYLDWSIYRRKNYRRNRSKFCVWIITVKSRSNERVTKKKQSQFLPVRATATHQHFTTQLSISDSVWWFGRLQWIKFSVHDVVNQFRVTYVYIYIYLRVSPL